MKEPVSILEFEQYLFARTLVQADGSPEVMFKHIRESFRLHRFFVFTWLVMNGVALPVELVSDTAHPRVGEQKPDQPA